MAEPNALEDGVFLREIAAMFRAVWEFWEKRKKRKLLKQLFSKPIGRKIADALVASDLSARTPLSAEWNEHSIDFIFISIHSDEAERAQERLAILISLAEAGGAFINSLYPITVLSFGMVKSRPEDACATLVQELAARAPWASLVHGSVRAHVGLIGAPTRFDFDFWWKEKSAAIARLAELAPGECVRWESKA